MFLRSAGLVLVTSIFLTGCSTSSLTNNTNTIPTTSAIRYVALGDSYTIGEGAGPEQAWPQVLTNHLQHDGIDITLVANPSVTGWTTQQLIDHELPVVTEQDANFVTVLIGVNDYVQGVPAETFQKRIQYIFDTLLETVPANRIVVITIPDFSVTISAGLFGNPATLSAGIKNFNAILTEEAQQRNLTVVDIFPLSQAMKWDDSLIATDGLHPSAKEYLKWEEVIHPIVANLLYAAS